METKLELNPNKNIYNENPIFSKCTWPASSQNACPDNCWINPDGTMSEKTKEGGFCASPHKRFKCWKFDKEASCDIGLTENGENPVMETKQDGCTLTCTFDTTKIRTPEQWKNLTWKFNLTDDQKQQVLFSYCALDSKEDCAAINGIVPNSCSRLVSKNFQECNILNNEKNSFTDAIKQNYAANYPDNLDTACLNRANDKVYQKIKNGLSASTNDGCWYTACTNSVIPRLSDINADNCPTNMCMQIYNIDNVTKAEISGNKNIIDCTSPSPPPSPTPTPSPSPTPPTPSPTPTPTEKNSNTIVLIFSIVGGILIILLFAYLLYRNSKKVKNEKTQNRKTQKGKTQNRKTQKGKTYSIFNRNSKEVKKGKTQNGNNYSIFN